VREIDEDEWIARSRTELMTQDDVPSRQPSTEALGRALEDAQVPNDDHAGLAG
jgi:hypothetical protein